MIGVVLVAHGNLAQEFLNAAQHVLGPQENVIAVTMSSDGDRTDGRKRICHSVEQVDCGNGVLILVDIPGATPFKLCDVARRSAQTEMIYGMNLPMLLHVLKDRNMPLSVAAQNAVTAGRKYMDVSSK